MQARNLDQGPPYSRRAGKSNGPNTGKLGLPSLHIYTYPFCLALARGETVAPTAVLHPAFEASTIGLHPWSCSHFSSESSPA